MTTYAIAQLKIHDRETYARYVRNFLDVLGRYDAALLAADERPAITEGEWEGHKVVLLAFRDRDEFDRWANSTEYRTIAQDRLSSTHTTVLVVRGLQPWPETEPRSTTPASK